MSARCRSVSAPSVAAASASIACACRARQLATNRASSSNNASVTLDGHLSWVNPADNETINTPTMIRTGTGSIDIAAANNISLLDQTAPGVIYTGGAPAAGAPVGSSSTIDKHSGLPDILVTNAVNPDSAGGSTVGGSFGFRRPR